MLTHSEFNRWFSPVYFWGVSLKLANCWTCTLSASGSITPDRGYSSHTK